MMIFIMFILNYVKDAAEVNWILVTAEKRRFNFLAFFLLTDVASQYLIIFLMVAQWEH